MKDNAILKFILDVRNPQILNTVPRITYMATRNRAQSYLEIGVNKGSTFLEVNLPCKVGVDPSFNFDWQSARTEKSLLFQTTSDEFFGDLQTGGPSARAMQKVWPRADLAFDIIFIDGLHTFAQSLRDFENSLAYSHDDTIWILDDTVPANPYSACPDLDFSMKLRALTGFWYTDWCGDVYKTVFAIHDRHPQFSYCTLMGYNPQTVLWRSGGNERKPVFSSLEEIDRQSYFDIFKYAELFIPVPDEEFPLLLGKPLRPGDYKAENLWERLVYMDHEQRAPKEFL